MTFDNGTEFARHAEVARALPLAVYSTAPYASYRRGTNENTNGLLRRSFPKGNDLRRVTPAQLARVVDQLNNRPRKILGYRTPNEVYQEERQRKLCALGT